MTVEILRYLQLNGLNMATIRDQRKCTEWQKRMTRYQRSGLSIAEFCKSEEVPVHRFYYWAKRCAAARKASATAKGKIEKVDPDSANPVVRFELNRNFVVSVPVNCLDTVRCVLEYAQAKSSQESPFQQVVVR